MNRCAFACTLRVLSVVVFLVAIGVASFRPKSTRVPSRES